MILDAIKLALKLAPIFKTKAGLYLTFLILSTLGGGYLGWKTRDYSAESERLSAVENAIKQAAEQAEIDAAILEDSVETQKEIAYVFKTIEKEAKHVKTPECNDLGDDWRRVYNDAVKASTSKANN